MDKEKYNKLIKERDIKVEEYNKYYSFSKLDDENIDDMVERLKIIRDLDSRVQIMASDELTRISNKNKLSNN
jgi:hypothetical protein